MNFLVVTNAPTLLKDEKKVAYSPYVTEMDIWFQNFSSIKIVSPTKFNKPLLTSSFAKQDITVSSIPDFTINGIGEQLRTIFKIPVILIKIFNAMLWADHIHLRCPGNVGLLGCFVQILFPNKPKTVKYAGNWDAKSKQPWSYRLQKRILSNTFLTKNCKVLVYGEWKNQTKNIVPFFTATYKKEEIENIPKKQLNEIIKFIFVGAFSIGKQPLTSIKVVEKLYRLGKKVQLQMYGNGHLFDECKDYIKENQLEDVVFLHGNQPKAIVKKAFQNTHFLIFISKSEGWPKVVSEAMFWSCLPISTAVSCVPVMLGNGTRGSIVTNNVDEIVQTITQYINKPTVYAEKVERAKKWSQNYTLNTFESEIKKLLVN